jgi:hypothetical protein
MAARRGDHIGIQIETIDPDHGIQRRQPPPGPHDLDAVERPVADVVGVRQDPCSGKNA